MTFVEDKNFGRAYARPLQIWNAHEVRKIDVACDIAGLSSKRQWDHHISTFRSAIFPTAVVILKNTSVTNYLHSAT